MQAIIRILPGLAMALALAQTGAAQETSLRPVARPAPAAAAAPVAGETPALGQQRPVARADAAADQGVSVGELLAPVRPLAVAMNFVRAGQWPAAAAEARGDGPVAEAIVEWHRLRAGQGSPTEVLLFLRAYGDWPGISYLREKSEPSFLTASPAEVRAFFEGYAPQTAAGALALARVQSGDEAAMTAIAGWRSFPMTDALQAGYLDAFGAALGPHHAARLDAMLWQGASVSASRMLPLVSDEVRAVAAARLAYAARAGDIPARFDAVPEALRSSPGLAHARFEWMMSTRQRDRAVELMTASSGSAATLGQPEAWADRRIQLVREEMRSGRHAEAYALAAPHHLAEGTDYSELEWLAGWLSLRLNEPARALEHFRRLDRNVDSPISKGRAGYWRGRALEAMGRADDARAAYTQGGAFQTSFYGLLAAEKAGLPPDPALAGTERFPDWRDAPWRDTDVFRAAILLLAADEPVLAERFFTHLSERLDRTSKGQLGDLLAVLERPHIQVMLGKRAATEGIELPGPYYALHPVAGMDHPVPTELVLAIARRESEFDPVVVSGAGARGLMQLMPGTAQEVSRALGLPYGRERLLSDFEYNATLGAEYLRGLAERFDGNVVMMAAGYNAGPGRPIQWIERNGDPRRGAMDVIDWIELIPFTETRNYVMRVAESLPVYRARLGKPPHPVPFSQELVGSTLRPVDR